MLTMTREGAQMIIENSLEYDNVVHLETTKAYHYFSAQVLVEEQAELVKHEVRIDAQENIDGQFYIQSRPWGSEYWEHVDSVSCDWSQDN